MCDQCADRIRPEVRTVDRRAAIARCLGTLGGGAMLASGLLSTGCAASGESSGRLGQPIPDPTTPPPPAARPPVARSVDLSCPSGVIPRTRWATYGPDRTNANLMLPPRRITIHHDALNVFTSTSESAAARRLEQIRLGHRRNQWADIGYHFAIDPAGRAWECRPLTLQGAHVSDHNPGNIGILVLGNFEEQHPSRAAVAAAEALTMLFMNRYAISPRGVFVHRELGQTKCPGRFLAPVIIASRSSGELARA